MGQDEGERIADAGGAGKSFSIGHFPFLICHLRIIASANDK
jgi:hypothetical protein